MRAVALRAPALLLLRAWHRAGSARAPPPPPRRPAPPWPRLAAAFASSPTGGNRPSHASAELFFASGAGEAKHVQELLAQGANPAAGLPEHAGATPLHAAAAAGSAAAVQLLLDAGAPADARDGLQRTPTMLAVLRGHGSTEVVRQLAAAGASMGACCAYGHTPLILAGALGDAPAVDLLLRLGSDPLRTDSKGLTPLAAARRRHAKAVLPDEELAEPEGPGTPGGPDYDAVVRLLEAAEVGRWRSGGEGAGQRGGEAGTA